MSKFRPRVFVFYVKPSNKGFSPLKVSRKRFISHTSFIDWLVRSSLPDADLVLFLIVYGPRLLLGPETHTKKVEHGQYPAIQASRLVNNGAFS